MAKLVTDYGMAVLKSVTPRPDKVAWESPNWREWYIGKRGHLQIWESERKRPGWVFVEFFNGEHHHDLHADEEYDAWELKTWYGNPVVEGNTMTFTTRTSIYEFELGEDVHFEQFLRERMQNGKEAEKQLPPARLAVLREQWEKELPSTAYMAWFNALPPNKRTIVLGWEAEMAKEE